LASSMREMREALLETPGCVDVDPPYLADHDGECLVGRRPRDTPSHQVARRRKCERLPPPKGMPTAARMPTQQTSEHYRRSGERQAAAATLLDVDTRILLLPLLAAAALVPGCG